MVGFEGSHTGAAKVRFYATDTVVTGKDTVVVVGWQWTPDIKSNNSNIFNYFRRKAVFSVLNSTAQKDTCEGCETMYYGNDCSQKCPCQHGYCNDDRVGDGTCYCTLYTYNKTCDPCPCIMTDGLCDHGPNGTGLCSFCWDFNLTSKTVISMCYSLILFVVLFFVFFFFEYDI